jgi:hypothetical protein
MSVTRAGNNLPCRQSDWIEIGAARLRDLMKHGLTTTLLVLAGIAGASVATAGELKTTAPAKVNLTGLWKINEEQSDDPHKVVAKKKEDSSGGGPIRGGGGGPGGVHGGGVFDTGGIFGDMGGTIGRGGVTIGRGGGAGGAKTGSADRPDGDPESTMKVPLDSFLATREQLEIKQLPDTVTVSSVDDSVTCKPGEFGKAPTPSGEMVDLYCGWKGSTYVTELREPDGVTRTTRYELRRGDKQLVMISEIKGGHTQMSGLTIKRVYDRMVSSF